MSEQSVTEPTPQPAPEPEEKAGAFAKDQQFGRRLNQAVAIGEPFLLLGGIPGEAIETKYGLSETVKLLIQKINPDTGAPQGAPLRVTSVASAIVEKVKALTPAELAAGPVVALEVVASKARGVNAEVITWIRNLTDAEDYSEFGLDPNEVSQRVDQARPSSERIPY